MPNKEDSKKLADLLRNLGDTFSTLSLFPQLFDYRYKSEIQNPRADADAEAVMDFAKQIEGAAKLMQSKEGFIKVQDIVTKCFDKLFVLESAIAPRYWDSLSVRGRDVNKFINEWIERFVKLHWRHAIREKACQCEMIKKAWSCANERNDDPLILCTKEIEEGGRDESFYFDGRVRECIIEILSNVVHRSTPIKRPPMNVDPDMGYEISYDAKSSPPSLQIEFSNLCACDAVTLKSTPAKVGLEIMGGQVTPIVETEVGGQLSGNIVKTLVRIPSVSYATTDKPA